MALLLVDRSAFPMVDVVSHCLEFQGVWGGGGRGGEHCDLPVWGLLVSACLGRLIYGGGGSGGAASSDVSSKQRVGDLF